jgi:regulator of sigma E protease
MEFLSTGSNIVLILLGFGALIFVHEMGHFLSARWARLRCESFAIGMGPVLVAYRPGMGFALGSTEPATIRKFGKSAYEMSDEELARNGLGETEYSLRVLPLGGFVRLLGQEDISPTDASVRPRSYHTIAVWKRMVVVSGGVVANLVLGMTLFVVAFLAGVKFEAPTLGIVGAASPASMAQPANATLAEAGGRPGLQLGDRVVAIDGDPTFTFADIQIATAMARPGRVLVFSVERPGVDRTLEFAVKPEYVKSIGMQSIGVGPAGTNVLGKPDVSVRAIVDGELASAGLLQAGVGAGSTLMSVAGKAIEFSFELDRAFEQSQGATLPTQWRTADGRTVDVSVTPKPEFEPTAIEGSEESTSIVMGLAGLVPLTKVDSVDPDGAAFGHLQAGDVVLRAGMVDAPTSEQFRAQIAKFAGNSVPLEIERNGQRLSVLAPVSSQGRAGIVIGNAWDDPRIAAPGRSVVVVKGVVKDEPSPSASLKVEPFSRWAKVAGEPVANWVEARGALQRAIAAQPGPGPILVPIELLGPRANREPSESAAPVAGTLSFDRAQADEVAALGWRWPLSPGMFVPVMATLNAEGSPLTAIKMGFRQTGKMLTMTYLTIDRLFRGSVGVENLRGPVGIVHLGAGVADRGFMYVVFFLAAISINLAVLNFLPLPIVDGGLFAYLVYERITGKPPSPQFQNAAIGVGLCLLGGLFLLTFYQDVMRLIAT